MKMPDAVCVYGAQIMSKHLSAMAGEMDGVRAAEDIEYVHRMRVASRRMRSALALFKRCFFKKDYQQINSQMRTVTKALGEARDLDVQIAVLNEVEAQYTDEKLKPGVKRLILRLTHRRAEAQMHVCFSIDQLEQERVLENTANFLTQFQQAKGQVYLFSPSLYQLAFEGIKMRIDALLKHEPYIHDPNNQAELHAMRISAKRLRYTLEAFEDLYGSRMKPFINTMKDLQDLLGLIHDMDVWAAFIPEFIEEERGRIIGYFANDRPLKRLLPGLEAFRLSRLEVRAKGYDDFILLWQEITSQNLWQNLLKLINTPIDVDAAMDVMNAVDSEGASEAEQT